MRRAKNEGQGSSALERLARANGIQTSYIDNVGRKQFASSETLRLILDRLGVREGVPPLAMIDPVAVHWQKSR